MESMMMNDMKQPTNDGMNLNPLIGFALGAVVGAAIALLMAPASGERTRRRIGSVAKQWGNDAGRSIQDMRENVTDTVNDVATGLGADAKSAIDAGLEALRHESDGSESRTGSRVAQAMKSVLPRGL
jgi:gas vesicle protein